MLTNRHFLHVLLALLTSFVIAASAHAAIPLPAAQADELTKLYQTYSATRLAAIAARKQAERQQSDIAALKANLPKLASAVASANTEYKKLQDFDRENPDRLKPEHIAAARGKLRQAQAAKKDAIANLETAIGNYNRTVKETDNARLAEQHAHADYLARFDQMASEFVTQRVNTLKKPRDNIEATAYKPCDDLAVKECKKAAQKEAERKAIEKGSIIVVNSITEIQNLTLKRDEVRSEVHGAISNLKIVSAVLKDDPAAYSITINTTVTPIITEPLLREIHQSVRMDMSAQVGDGGLSVQQAAAYQPQPSYLSVEATPAFSQSEPSADGGLSVQQPAPYQPQPSYLSVKATPASSQSEPSADADTASPFRFIIGKGVSNYAAPTKNTDTKASFSTTRYGLTYTTDSATTYEMSASKSDTASTWNATSFGYTSDKLFTRNASNLRVSKPFSEESPFTYSLGYTATNTSLNVGLDATQMHEGIFGIGYRRISPRHEVNILASASLHKAQYTNSTATVFNSKVGLSYGLAASYRYFFVRHVGIGVEAESKTHTIQYTTFNGDESTLAVGVSLIARF